MKAWLGAEWVRKAGGALVGGPEGHGKRERGPTTADANPMKKFRRRRRACPATPPGGPRRRRGARRRRRTSRRRRRWSLPTSPGDLQRLVGRERPTSHVRPLFSRLARSLPRPRRVLRGRAGPASPGPRAVAMPASKKRARDEAAESDRLTADEAEELGKLFLKGYLRKKPRTEIEGLDERCWADAANKAARAAALLPPAAAGIASCCGVARRRVVHSSTRRRAPPPRRRRAPSRRRRETPPASSAAARRAADDAGRASRRRRDGGRRRRANLDDVGSRNASSGDARRRVFGAANDVGMPSGGARGGLTRRRACPTTSAGYGRVVGLL